MLGADTSLGSSGRKEVITDEGKAGGRGVGTNFISLKSILTSVLLNVMGGDRNTIFKSILYTQI